MKYRPGTKVKLLPFEGEPAQTGIIISGPSNDTYIIFLDDEYIDYEEDDDGLREVPVEQIEPLGEHND